jgi:hypothetical protein
MSGIVGSYFNTRGSGVVAKLGTDGQVFTSTGAGLSQGFEAAAGGGAWNLLTTLTASTSGDLSFVDGASDVDLTTYNHYVFACNSIHGSVSAAGLTFQGSIDGGSNYNTNILSSVFTNYVSGTATDHSLTTRSNHQDGTGFQMITEQNGIEDSSCWSGELHIYNPGSAVFRKFFTSEFTGQITSEYQFFMRCSGRMETTSAVDAVQFKMESGNIDSGTISLYGISS